MAQFENRKWWSRKTLWQLVVFLTLTAQVDRIGFSVAAAPPAPDFEVPIEKPPLVLAEGEQRLLFIPGLVRYSLGSDAIRIHPLPKSAGTSTSAHDHDTLLIKGIHAGGTDLWVWKSNGTSEHRSARVEKTAGSSLKPEIEKVLQPLQETEILFSGSGVILRGTLKNLAEAARVEAATRGFPKEIHDETELSDSLLELGESKLDAWLGKSGYSSRLKRIRRDREIWIEGSVERPSELIAMQKRIKAIFAPTRIEIEALPDTSPTVHFRVFLLELKKNRYGALGLGWPGSQSGALRVSTIKIEDLVRLDLTLQALEGEGSLRILSNPELVVRAPGEAELFSGGEIPIHNRGHRQSSTDWKPFGLTLKLKVAQSAGDRVRLDIMTEVSYLDASIGGAGNEEKTPGLQANRMKTQVDARYGVPLLLSGLLKETMREEAKGLPFLRNLPVLGSLFGSEDYQNEKSELVAILVPRSTPPEPPIETMKRLTPRGPLPPPHEWVSPNEERQLKESPEYPWNALR